MVDASVGKVERTTEEKKTTKVQVEKITMTNVVLRSLLSDKFVKDLDKLSNDINFDVIPVSLILILESKNEKEKKIEHILLGHETKKDLLDKKISIQTGNPDLLSKVVDILKKV